MCTILLREHMDLFTAVHWMSPGELDSPAILEEYGNKGLYMWLLWGKHDEVVTSPDRVFPNGTEEYEGITNLSLNVPEWIYNGDGTIASSQGGKIEQGQHATNLQAIRNYVRDDGTPDFKDHPTGLSGWFVEILEAVRKPK